MTTVQQKPPATGGDTRATTPWYSEVTRYEWLVLAIASIGWAFDAFEGQIFSVTRSTMISDLLKVPPNHALVKAWADKLICAFLIGGTLGGFVFGSLADRIGRRPVLNLTILFYSIFAGMFYFANSMWHVAALLFMVGLGVGGEWAVGAALVAEVFPQKARAHASGIFHATSVLGVLLATAVWSWKGPNWRIAFLISIFPMLLTLWVRMAVKEPESWRKASAAKKKMGSFRDLLGHPRWRTHALCGMMLAAVGLGTFWAIVVSGQNLAKEMLDRDKASGIVYATTGFVGWIRNDVRAYGIVQLIGVAIGMLSFGPISTRIGRKNTFFLFMFGSMIVVPATCYLPRTYWELLMFLPFYGFFAQAVHAGFAVYFPELFPDHLRATGAGFCFNGGRLTAAPILFFSGWLKAKPNVDLHLALSLLSLLFGVGCFMLLFLPETKGKPLPEE